jgi:D-galacturonate reductase
MSQPKQQLKTFSSWAGTGVTDISYYLNSHHIDFHEWCMENSSRPVSVTAVASTGAAKSLFDINCEDTITLTVQWENLDENGTNIYHLICHVLWSVSSSSSCEFTCTWSLYVGRPSAHLGCGTAVYTSSWVAPQSDVHSQQRFFYMGQVIYFDHWCIHLLVLCGFVV